MSDSQINNEYHRILRNYRQALIDGQRSIVAELESLDLALTNNHRFHPRHGMTDLAETVLTVGHKLEVFSNFIWNPKEIEP